MTPQEQAAAAIRHRAALLPTATKGPDAMTTIHAQITVPHACDRCTRQHVRRLDWARCWMQAARQLRIENDRAGAARCLEVAAIYRGAPDSAARCYRLNRPTFTNNTQRRRYRISLVQHADTPTR